MKTFGDLIQLTEQINKGRRALLLTTLVYCAALGPLRACFSNLIVA